MLNFYSNFKVNSKTEAVDKECELKINDGFYCF